MKENIFVIHARDNVGVALRTIAKGEEAVAKGMGPFEALEEIPANHKVALKDIPAGEEVVKYGETVAVSTREIKKGEWVHGHNLESGRWRK